MPENFHKIFPEIPRYDNEAPLEGLPQSPEESAFLSIPELAKTADLATDFDKANSDKKRKVIDNLIVDLVENPNRFIQTLDSLALLKEVEAYKTELLEENLQRGVERVRFKKFPPSYESLNGWLAILTESNLYGSLAERVLKQMIGKCNDSKSIISFLYELGLAGMRSNNPEIVKKTLEILALQTKTLPADSIQTIYYLLGNLDPNDKVMQKTFEIGVVFTFLSKKYGTDFIKQKNKADEIIVKDPRFNEHLREIYNADPARSQKLLAMHKDNIGNFINEYGLLQKASDFNKFPFNLMVQDIGPLRKWYNNQVAKEYEEKNGVPVINLHLPNISAPFPIKEHLEKFICLELSKENPNGKVLENEDYWDTLSMLVPPEILEEKRLASLIATNQSLQRDIRDNTRYLLSPRGDMVEITDHLLKELGFKSILYEMDRHNRRDTVVTVKVGNFEYRILLDEYFSLREMKDRKAVHLPLSANFINNVILGHLREIRCSEKVNEIGDNLNGGDGARHAFTARRAHLRRLPAGQQPTSEQIKRALKTYDIDIVRINREAKASGKTHCITFVFEAQNVAIAGQEPVHSRAPEATKKLQEILRST